MLSKKIASILVTTLCAVLLSASCSEEVVYRRPGPPPHAPAHGHRRKYVSGVELIYDAGMGLYVVVGWPDYYYYDGTFYRLHAGLWQVSLYPDRDWGPLGQRVLPPGLHGRGHAKVKVQTTSQSQGRGRGHGKFKKTSFVLK